MPLELKQAYPTGTVRYDGGVSFQATSRKNVVLKVVGGGEQVEIFNVEVPVGKTWDVSINVSVKET